MNSNENIYKESNINIPASFISFNSFKKVHYTTHSEQGKQTQAKKFLNYTKSLTIKHNINYMMHYILYFSLIILIVPSLIYSADTTSKIIIKIDKSGTQKIFSDKYTGGNPNTILVNNYVKALSNERTINLESITNNIELIWNDPLENTSYMFYNISQITEVDLSNVYTEQLTNMSNMFSTCTGITSINLKNFKTHKVTNMVSLFAGCISLKSIDVSGFDTSKVVWIHYMFFKCASFTSLYVSNFDTSSARDMSSMFSNCYSLTTLDISNFDVSKVYSTGHMFDSCISLVSLNLSNFKTPALLFWDHMFKNCTNLAYINLINAFEITVQNKKVLITNILLSTMDNMVFCINRSSIPEIVNVMDLKKCKVYSCIENWKSAQKKNKSEYWGLRS